MLKQIARTLVSKWAARLSAAKLSPKQYKICILKTDRLGDAVLALGAIRLLVSEFGEEECILIVSQWGEALMKREFPLATVVTMPLHVTHRDLLRSGRRLRHHLGNIICDRSICLRHERTDWDEILLSWVNTPSKYLLDPDKVSCLKLGALRRTFFAKVKFRISEDTSHERPSGFNKELWRHSRLLENVLGRTIDYRTICPRLVRAVAPRRGECVLVCPFGSAQIRDYPPELLAQLIKEVHRYAQLPIYLQSDAVRRRDLVSLAELLSVQYSLKVECGPVTDVTEYIDLIAGADLVVTVDTATAHLAVALDRRAIILHGDAQPNEFVPWGERKRQQWVSRPMPCRGCNWICVHDRPLCMTDVSATMLSEAVSAVFRYD